MGMMWKTTHFITVLSPDHPSVKNVVRPSTAVDQTRAHFLSRLPETADGDEASKAALAMTRVIADLPIRAGHSVTLISGDDSLLEEHLIVQTIQRRFQETVDVAIIHDDKSLNVPYPMKPVEQGESMVGYNYKCGPCSGSCKSCK